MNAMAVSDTPVLVLDNVTKQYTQWQRSGQMKDILRDLVHPKKRRVMALNGISLSVEKGEFLAYAGANGAGKSTTIKILCGILQPTGGRVSVLGLDPARDRIALMHRIGIVFGQRTELWWDHPVITSYEWKKTVWDISDETYRKNLALVTELLDLGGLLRTFARELSLGQRMRADLGMMLLHGPELIFLDEPTLGLDVLAKKQMISFLRKLNEEQGVTIVATSHDMDDLETMARRMILLSHGKIAFDGDFDALRRVQGGLGRVHVTTGSHVPPALGALRYVSTQGETHEFAFDGGEADVASVLSQIAQTEGVRGVEIGRAPIEDVVADLYRSWKK